MGREVVYLMDLVEDYLTDLEAGFHTAQVEVFHMVLEVDYLLVLAEVYLWITITKGHGAPALQVF